MEFVLHLAVGRTSGGFTFQKAVCPCRQPLLTVVVSGFVFPLKSYSNSTYSLLHLKFLLCFKNGFVEVCCSW